MPIEISPERFDALVSDALDSIPDDLARLVENLVVLVEDEPPEGQPEDLLGLYDGLPLGIEPQGGELPARIFIFRGPLLDFVDSEDDLVKEVGITVVHEVAHHFGIDDERLHELGYA